MSVPDSLLGTREIASPDAMHDLGLTLGRVLQPGDVVVLTGGLGAGKTTLTRGIGEGLGIRGPVQSPTFVLARTHPSLVGGAPLVHVDAYRLGSAAELDDLDIDVAHSVVIVEWGRDMADRLTDTWWEVEITPQTGGRGLDSACGTIARHTADLDDDAPRTVTISRRP
jgi:tRNA threonylcarbamoyl adenosine modification protein YjeE